MKRLFTILLFTFIAFHSEAQAIWTESDRRYLLENLIRSRNTLIKETQGLTKAQWEFKESPDRWSINQIVEHIGYWEMLLDHEIANSLEAGKQPERIKEARADSMFVNFIYEEKKHYSLEYTKPFSYTIPMGLNDLKNNLTWLLKLRNESIEYVKTTNDDLRTHFNSYGSIHQIYIYVFGHMDRHISQIKKVKANAAYPKS